MEDRWHTGAGHPADDLTWREQEVLGLLSERLTNREIADRLHLAESTVKDYVGKIISKLYVKNRRQAVERGKALGLLGTDRETTRIPKNNLPEEPTPFVGRLDELQAIQRLLGATRLLTLTGPGGIGKTRLAIKAARETTSLFKDGCFLIHLARIPSSEHITQTIAEALKFPIATQEDPDRQLLRYLRKRQILLVMDNFEHVLDGAKLISEITQTAPGVKVLATSRERLNLQSETVFPVEGMATPGPANVGKTLDYDSVALFIQRAEKTIPGFQPSPKDLDEITKLCQTLQGMPLAIELAAAWLNILTLDEITAELDAGLDILATDMRDIPERHRSIQAVFDHSIALLDPKERVAFLRISIFRGGFTREAAQQVAGATLPLLGGLVNKSILSRDPSTGRLGVHELLRQYALEKLKDTPENYQNALNAHAAYYAAFMAECWEHLKDQRQMAALAAIEADIENLRVAWRFCIIQGNTSQIWQFIYGLWYVYWIRWWNRPGMELFAQAVEGLQPAEDPEVEALRALAMAFQGYFMAWLDLAEGGYELAQAGVKTLENLDEPMALVMAYDSLCVNAYMIHRYQEEIAAVKKMRTLGKALDDRWVQGFILFAAGMSALIQEDYPEAESLAHSYLESSTEVGDKIGASIPMMILGHIAFARSDYGNARKYYLSCLELAEGTGFHYALQSASKYLGKATISLGRLTEARQYLVQCLKLTEETGFVRDIINLLVEFARLRIGQGHPEEAVELLALVVQHPASLETRMFEGRIRDTAAALLSELKAELPEDTYTEAVQRGHTLILEKVTSDLIGSRIYQQL